MAWAFFLLGLSSLVACVLPPPQPISGTLSGAAGPVLLTNVADSGVYTMTVNNNGGFSFTTAVSQYNVTATSAVQTCDVKNGAGEVNGAPITNIMVTCLGQYSITANVSGLTSGNGNLVLTNGLSQLPPITADGTYPFPGTLNKGASYNISVASNPNYQTCVVANGQGSVTGDVTVSVTCTSTASYYLSGYIAGLLSSITLQNPNNMDTVTVINPNTLFTFPTPLEPNQNYSLNILTQPVDQQCAFIGNAGFGVTGVSDTTAIGVQCNAALRTVSVTVEGLSGTLQVVNNGTDTMNITQNGEFTFATALHDNSVFNVTVGSQPSTQACVIPNPYGQVNGADIFNIEVNCVSPSNLYGIGGAAVGLQGNVTLSNNGIDTITLTQDGTFTFPIHMANEAYYDVYITSQPAAQSCSIITLTGDEISQTGAGQVSNGPVTSLRLNCGAGYYVGGTITNLTGNTLRLLNSINGSPTDILAVKSGTTSYRFPTSLPVNATYSSQVISQPTGAVCTATNTTGNISNSNITNVNITCAAGTSHNYTVGGTVSGLTGTLVLSNDGFDTITLTSNGAFAFPTALGSTAPYDVSIVTQPSGLICTVQDGANTVTGENVTNVQVVCVQAYAVSVLVSGLSGGNVVLQAPPWEPTVVVTGNGTYTFPNAIPAQESITTTVASSPAHQQCLAVAPSGSFPGNFATQIVCGPFYDFIRGQSAVSVVGQNGFYTGGCNEGEGTTANSVCYPFGDAWMSSTGQAYFPDLSNNRALVYNSIPTAAGTSANAVLGQTSFTSNASGLSASTLNAPQGMGGATGKVVVVDTANSRLLIYGTPVTSGASATVVVGQSSMTTNTPSCSASGLNAPQSALIVNNILYVADTGNNRVLIYSPVPTASGASATTVVGQVNMTTCSAPSILALSGSVLNAPQDVWSDGTHLLVADTQDNRVLGWTNMPSNGGAADVVCGQGNMTSYGTGNSASGMAYPTSLASNGEQLFVADALNNRVLIFNKLPLFWSLLPEQGPAAGPSADAELGQVDFGYAYVNSLGGVPGPETLHRPSGVALNGNVLIVTDTGNNRFTIYEGF